MKVKVTESCPTLWDPMGLSPLDSSVHGDSPGKNTGMLATPSSRGSFPTQGSNPGLLHCRWNLYRLSHQGSPVRKLDTDNLKYSWPLNNIRVEGTVENLHIIYRWPSIKVISPYTWFYILWFNQEWFSAAVFAVEKTYVYKWTCCSSNLCCSRVICVQEDMHQAYANTTPFYV